MIQKTLVFVVDFTGKMIDGEKPVGFLRANDKNKNTIFLITPEQPTTQIKARFLAKTKHNDGVAVNGILTTDYKVNDLVSETKSYYEKIKDWNVFHFPVPERVVNYIASNAGSEIGITFEFFEWQLPRIKDIYGDFLGEITDSGFSIDANEDGYYVNRVIDYEYNGDKYGYNDLFIVGGGTITAIRAFPRTGGAVGGYFGVDPMYDSGVFEYVDGDDIDPSITTQIKNQVNNLTSEVYFLNVENEKNKTDIVDLYNRVNDNASDIDKIEDGTTIVGKALRDNLGNVIKDSYVSAVYPTYNNTTDKLFIETYNVEDGLLANNEVVLPKATTTKNGLMSATDKVKVDNIASDIASMGATKQSLSEKNQINGYAGLDTNAKIPSSLLPDSVLGQLEYKGTFTPTAYPSSPEKGWFYISIGNGIISGVDFQVGDWAVFNGSTWDKVDNTDAVMSVNGKLGVVVLNGTDIKVGNGDTWTIEQRIVNIYAELNNRYTKAQTYSQTEIEQRLTDLLGMANLQDILIGSYTDGQTVLASDLSAYNFVIALGKDANDTYTGTFKPSEIVSGNVISLSPTVYLTRGATNFTITTPTSIKMWGIKLDGITADDISYLDSNVKEALDSLLVPAYITATHEALQTEITATDAFEINDETGDVVKITGNEPTNLIVNGDFSNGLTGWSSYWNATLSIENGYLKVVKSVDANISVFRMTTPTGIIGDKYFYCMDVKTSGTDYFDYAGIYNIINSSDTTLSMMSHPRYNSSNGVFSDFTRISSLNTLTHVDNPTGTFISISTSGAKDSAYYIDNIKLYNVSEMIRSGYKADDGRLLSALSDAELKVQMNIWLENGFQTVVEKLVSKSDNLLNGTFSKLTSLESENLVANSDLLIDSNSDGIPDGFYYTDATDISLVNGIAKFTATAKFGKLELSAPAKIFNSTDIFYNFARVKSSKTGVGIVLPNGRVNSHSGSGNFEFLSACGIFTNISLIAEVTDNKSSDWGEVEVDYVGAYNITDLVNRGILPVGLTNAQYKEMIDKAMFTNVPLRETNYVAVEPSKAYKLIKVSANEVTHKVIEYTTDNQVVKVTPVVYTTNKFTFTTHALTSKIKLVSDMLERPTNLVDNGDFSGGVSPWTTWYNAALDVVDGRLRVTKNASTAISNFVQRKDIEVNTTDIYYFACNFESSSVLIYFRLFALSGDTNAYIQSPSYWLPANTPAFLSHIGVFNDTVSSNILGFGFATAGAVGTDYFVDNIMSYNITDFIKKGVVNDSGTLFSRLTNDEIKDQMDIWIKAGFPDHVIAALYPNGVDSAISLKYNDADDIFRPQQIDVLPLDLTLRSGEYWKDGYVVKQNGNAEYYPLNTKFSAWNYGQLEAVYTSGVPADFDLQYAQNTAGQVKTTQEFLVEAREQLDYVTEGYDYLVEKLGDAIFSDKYDSYAGITSDTYEYYTLEGIKEGNTLAIVGAGQSIQNLLGKGGTINATTTVRGVTVTYDNNTGAFTANGTATAGKPFNITLATGMDFGLPVGTPIQLMRYYDGVDSGTINLNGSYVGYTITGVSTSNRINENSEALYDPYINGSGNLTANHSTNKQQLLLQVWAPGIVFTNFKFKIGIYDGLQLRPFILPSGEPAKSNVTVYNRTANMLNMPTALNIEDSGLTLTYDPLVQEFLLSGTATATKDISLSATFNVLSGDRLSIKRLYQSGDVTAAGGTLPRLKLVNSGGTAIVYNDIYKMTAPEGQIPTPDVSFNTGTAPADDTLTLKLGITTGQVFDNYRFRLMIHDKSTDIGYVAYRRDSLGNMSVGANERAVIEFKAIPYGILEFVADSESLNLLYADGITDLNKTYLEYNAGIISPNRKISELTARAELIDNPFRNKVIAVWGDSRESNNPTSDPSGVGDQKDTSWPALLAKKLNATVLNYGLSGGAWAENTVQQDAASAIVNRVQTEDISASADVIVISSMNDFKLASVLGSPLLANKDKTTFYGAMRLTYDRLATKYPGKKIVLVLPQKRYDETVNYGGGSYYHYLKAQVEVANEYGIPIVDLYHNFPNTKPTFYDTYMLNDTHFSAVGNDRVAELVARELIGNGNKGDMDLIPPIPTTDGTYTLKVTITGGIPVFTWVVD